MRNSMSTSMSIRVSMSFDGLVASLMIWRISLRNGRMPSLQFLTITSNLKRSFEDFDQLIGTLRCRISPKNTEISFE